MASPQRENGHIDIANEIAEALAKTQLSGYESRILWVILRKTYGWHKKEDAISITQFQKATGLDRRNIFRTLKKLEDRKIVVKNDNSFIKKWAFQKDYERWKTIVKNDNNSKLLSKMTTRFVVKNDAHKRKLTKEINNIILLCQSKPFSKDRTLFQDTKKFVLLWHSLYSLDFIYRELKKMLVYLESNPKKASQYKNFRKFISNWLNRANEGRKDNNHKSISQIELEKIRRKKNA